MSTTSFNSWDFHKYRVQQELTGGQFVNAESTLIAAGPPHLSDAGDIEGESVYPIGLLETFGLQQSRQLQRIFEIGSSRSYFIPGRTIGSITLGRTFYFGPSLLRVLYSYWKGNADGTPIGMKEPALPANADEYAKSGDQALLAGLTQQRDLYRNPGYGFMLMDLASDLFSQPTGMAVYFKDANTDTLGGFYLEECYVQGHQMTVSSGSVLIMEGASLQYDLLVPIDLGPKAG
jgi:hypothetical protein